jgi:hypothetical protein
MVRGYQNYMEDFSGETAWKVASHFEEWEGMTVCSFMSSTGNCESFFPQQKCGSLNSGKWERNELIWIYFLPSYDKCVAQIIDSSGFKLWVSCQTHIILTCLTPYLFASFVLWIDHFVQSTSKGIWSREFHHWYTFVFCYWYWPFYAKTHVNNIEEVSPYLEENTLHLHYKDHCVNPLKPKLV